LAEFVVIHSFQFDHLSRRELLTSIDNATRACVRRGDRVDVRETT